MCDWLTLAVPHPDALAPLQALGCDLEPATHPALPPASERTPSQRFLVTLGGCSCKLFGADARGDHGLRDALLTIVRANDGVLAHRTEGDAPRGQRALAATIPLTVDAFVYERAAASDRWARLVAPFDPQAPPPPRLDGARVLASAALREPAADGAVALAIVEVAFTPGVVLRRCDANWRAIDEVWFASEREAREAAGAASGRLRWATPLP